MSREEFLQRVGAAWAQIPDMPTAEMLRHLSDFAIVSPDDTGKIAALFEGMCAGMLDRRADRERAKRRERKPVQP